LGEAGYPFLHLREEYQTFAIVEGGKVDFFQNTITQEEDEGPRLEDFY